MKKGMVLLLAACVLAAGISFAWAEEKTILVLGDSISTGYGLLPRQPGFADLLGKNLGFRVINRAVNGSTAADWLTLLAEGKLKDDIAAADVITITIGGNDLTGLLYMQICDAYNASMQKKAQWISVGEVGGILGNASDSRQKAMLGCVQVVLMGDEASGTPSFFQSPAMKTAMNSYVTALNLIIANLRAVNAEAAIIVATQYNPFKAFMNTPYELLASGVDVGAQLLSDAITVNSADGHYLVADVYAAFDAADEKLCNAGPQPFSMDVHPNAAGHAVIAECFAQALTGE